MSHLFTMGVSNMLDVNGTIIAKNVVACCNAHGVGLESDKNKYRRKLPVDFVLLVLFFCLSRTAQACTVNNHGVKVLQQRVTECLQKLHRHMVSKSLFYFSFSLPFGAHTAVALEKG